MELMPLFIIDAENHITAYATNRQVSLSKGRYGFANARELAKLAAGWPAARLVEIWNKLPHVDAVRRFTDRKAAVRRIWGAVQELEPSRSKRSAATRSVRRKTPRKANRARGRDGTKTERIIALVKRPSGATLTEIMTEAGWQSHSVRAFICQLPRRFGFQIESFKRGAERVYRILR